jgi:microcystin-dependent protein
MGGFLSNSATAASNTSIGSISVATGAPVANLDNAVRELAAQGRQFADDFGGAGAVSGSANAIVYTPVSGALTAFADKDFFVFIAAYTNTGAATFTVGSASASIKKSLAGVETQLSAGDIVEGGLYMVRYRSSWGDFMLVDLNSSIAELLVIGFSNLEAALVVTEAEDIASNDNDTTIPTSAAVKDYVDTEVAGIDPATVPVGTMLDYAGSSEPSGWLFCYGQSLSRASYSALFTALGTAYGAVDGSSFSLPDCRGRIVAGKDDMGGVSADRLTAQSGGVNGDTLGATGGEERHDLAGAGMPDNTTSSIWTKSSDNSVLQIVNDTGHTGTASEPHNNVQPSIVFNKIIYAGA